MTAHTYDTDVFARATHEGSIATMSQGPSQASGWFTRMMEAIGRSYYVETADGDGYYVLPC
jgi:hypothetical protein